MSFSLSGLTDGLSSVADFITGGAAVRLGSFTFQAFEVPERIASGGAQANTLHKLPGGVRIMDVSGPDHAPVTWSGVFLGPNAKQRARQLNIIRVIGAPVDLVWGTTRLRVVLCDCTFDEGFNQIAYRVTCEIVPLPPAPNVSVKESLLDQIGDAIGVSDLTGQVAAASDALTSAQESLRRISSVLPAIPGLASVTMSLNTAASLTQSAADGAGGTLDALTSIATPSGLSGAVNASGVLAGGVAASSLAGAGAQTISAL